MSSHQQKDQITHHQHHIAVKIFAGWDHLIQHLGNNRGKDHHHDTVETGYTAKDHCTVFPMDPPQIQRHQVCILLIHCLVDAKHDDVEKDHLIVQQDMCQGLPLLSFLVASHLFLVLHHRCDIIQKEEDHDG